MNEAELKRLISRVALEVLKREQASLSKLTQETDMQGKQTVVLIPGLVPFAEDAVCELKKRYSGSMISVTFGQELQTTGIPSVDALLVGQNKILEMLSTAEHIVLLAPTIKLISDLAEGKDDLLPEYLFLHALLWGKQTAAWLDFEIPKRGKILSGSKIIDHLDTLKNAGVELICYRKKQEMQTVEKGLLMTEETVLRAFHAGKKEIILQTGMIVTPLARDAACELGLRLNIPEVL